MKGQQIPLPGVLGCGFQGCIEDAICGLRNKEFPMVRVNVCLEHFKMMMGRPPEVGELEKLGQEVPGC